LGLATRGGTLEARPRRASQSEHRIRPSLAIIHIRAASFREDPPPPAWNTAERIAPHRAMTPEKRRALTIEVRRAVLRFRHGRRLDVAERRELQQRDDHEGQRATRNMMFFTDTSEGDVVSCRWDFGDPSSAAASISAGRNPQHRCATPGAYRIALTVTDELGSTQQSSRSIPAEQAR
jgi:hypothetical protein